MVKFHKGFNHLCIVYPSLSRTTNFKNNLSKKSAIIGFLNNYSSQKNFPEFLQFNKADQGEICEPIIL